MKQAGYFILFFLTLYATSCSDMSEVESSGQGLKKNDIKPIKTLTIGENKYVTGWQLGWGNSVNYRGTPKQLVKEESNGIENSPADLERDNPQVTNNNSESNATVENKYVIGQQLEGGDSVNYRGTPEQLVKEESNGIENSPADLERDNSQAINNNSESNATQRKIKGYQATRDPKTGKMIIYPVYEDEKD